MAMHNPGTLHTGGTVPGTVHQDPARNMGGVAPPQGGMATHTERNTNTYDNHSSDTHTQREIPVPVAAGAPRSGRFSLNNSARAGLALTQLLTLASFLVAVGGLAALQHRANNLNLVGAQQNGYAEIFQSGNQIPYNKGSHQFGFQWYILALEILITLVVLACLVMPRKLLRLKHIAMALLAYAFTLTTLQVASLMYFRRSSAANALYGRRRILVTLIGTMAGAICNGLSIIFLGLLRNKNEFDDYHNNHGRGRFGGKGKRVGVDHQGGDYATGPAAV